MSAAVESIRAEEAQNKSYTECVVCASAHLRPRVCTVPFGDVMRGIACTPGRMDGTSAYSSWYSFSLQKGGCKGAR
jgi:hypothetical protein